MGEDFDGMQVVNLGTSVKMYIDKWEDGMEYDTSPITYKPLSEYPQDENDVPDIRELQLDILDESVWVTRAGVVIEWPAIGDSHLHNIIKAMERGDNLFGQGYKINRARSEQLSRNSNLKSAIADLFDSVTEAADVGKVSPSI